MDVNPLERLEIRNYSVTTEGDAFYIVGQIMSVDLLPEKVLREYIKKLQGKEVRLEHAIIEHDPYSMVGEVVDVWWDDKLNAPFAKSLIYNETEIERQLRKDLIEDQKKPNDQRKYKGFSIGILNSKDKITKQSVKIFPRELTITASPICKECTIESIGEYSMSLTQKDLDILKEDFTKKLDDNKKEHEKKLSEFSAANEVLTTKLNLSTKDLDAFKETIKTKDIEINTLKESVRRAEVEPIVNMLLDSLQFAKTSDIFKAKKEKWMKLEKDILLEMAENAKQVVSLFGQSNPALGGGMGIPIESPGRVTDNGVGEARMSTDLTKRVI